MTGSWPRARLAISSKPEAFSACSAEGERLRGQGEDMAESTWCSQAEVLREELNELRGSLVDAATGEPAPGQRPLSALCISGGGIRSATFSLGVLQGLAELGLLSRFDYLSTVSGGGYIGSWLTAWITRCRGIEAVLPDLVPREASPGTPAPSIDPIAHLRDYNSYLSPRRGAFSIDTWTIVATVLRNILLNWFVLVPLLLVVLMVPRLYLSLLALSERMAPAGALPPGDSPFYDSLSQSPIVELVLPLTCMALFATAFFNTLRYLPTVGGKSHDHGQYYAGVLAPLVCAVLAYFVFESLYFLGSNYDDYSDLGFEVIATAVPCAAAWLLFLVSKPSRIGERLRGIATRMSGAIAAMAAGTGIALWVTTNVVLWNVDQSLNPSWETYATTGPPLGLLGYCLATVAFIGLSSGSLHDEDREWMSRAVAGVLVACVGWMGLCSVVLLLPRLALEWSTLGHGVTATLAGMSAWLTTVADTLRPRGSDGAPKGGAAAHLRAADVAIAAAPVVFLVVLSVALSVLIDVLIAAVTGADWRDHHAILIRTGLGTLSMLTLSFLALSWFLARYVNINTFSLHGMYRDRLVRAYLGASNPSRRANLFTGFDGHDDLPVATMRATRPLHVLNLTLNLVRPDKLAWQQRKAESFVVTPLSSGSARLGYRPSLSYGGSISLGTAVAISGGAASPGSGSRTTPLRGFLMTLFNARQGVWLGNPGPAGEKTWTEPSPRSAVRLLAKEALGLASDTSEYVYLSDGGHFENLALYEMVRRKCREIVAIDSGCDPDFAFEDLGNALRKIRIDFGVSIEFDAGHFDAMMKRERRWATATVRYSDADPSASDGRLLYFKPVILGDEQPDVRAYADANGTFPHETTANQWFNEAQTESYRQLGLHSVRTTSAGVKPGSLTGLFEHLAEVRDVATPVEEGPRAA
jgi:hypothetical protein